MSDQEKKFSECIGGVKMSDGEVRAMNDFNISFKTMCNVIEDVLPHSRPRAVALTKIQEASMFINNAISRHGVKE